MNVGKTNAAAHSKGVPWFPPVVVAARASAYLRGLPPPFVFDEPRTILGNRQPRRVRAPSRAPTSWPSRHRRQDGHRAEEQAPQLASAVLDLKRCFIGRPGLPRGFGSKAKPCQPVKGTRRSPILRWAAASRPGREVGVGQPGPVLATWGLVAGVSCLPTPIRALIGSRSFRV